MMFKRISKMGPGRRDGLFPAGQTVLEFTFCMIIVLLMIYGVAKVFFWTGRDLVQRRQAHDAMLFDESLDPVGQLNPDFYNKITKMNAIWDGN